MEKCFAGPLYKANIDNISSIGSATYPYRANIYHPYACR